MKRIILLCVISLFIFMGCGGSEGGDDNLSSEESGTIEVCKTNGNCGGCCSSHGGVACRNGISICRDGTPMSDVCIGKGCNSCVGCASIEPCTEVIDNKGGLPYFEEDIEHPLMDDGGNFKIFTVNYAILPIHKTHIGECTVSEKTLALYFEFEYKEYVEGYDIQFDIYVEIKGERSKISADAGNTQHGIDWEEYSPTLKTGYFYFPPENRCQYVADQCYNFPEDITALIIEVPGGPPASVTKEIYIPMFTLR